MKLLSGKCPYNVKKNKYNEAQRPNASSDLRTQLPIIKSNTKVLCAEEKKPDSSLRKCDSF
jgi:hypothetical protein